MRIDLFDRTREFIAAHLASLKAPCVACSFGKDSMVMLWLVREQMPDVPVVYFEHFDIPSKHAFARQVAEEWGLNLHVIRAKGITFYGRVGHVELVAAHELAPSKFVMTPIEPQPNLPATGAICGVDSLYEEWPGMMPPVYDGVFIGHRSDDQDILMGAIPLSQDVFGDDDFKYIYPLRDWTAKDVWDFHRRYSVPVNGDRYGKKDVEANNDLWPLCTRCMASDEPVKCPKTGETIPGLARFLNLQERTDFWREVAVNLEKAA